MYGNVICVCDMWALGLKRLTYSVLCTMHFAYFQQLKNEPLNFEHILHQKVEVGAH